MIDSATPITHVKLKIIFTDELKYDHSTEGIEFRSERGKKPLTAWLGRRRRVFEIPPGAQKYKLKDLNLMN